MKKERLVELDFSVGIPSHPDQADTLDKQVAYLLGHYDNNLTVSKRVLETAQGRLKSILRSAFDKCDPNALLEVHKTLYIIYEISFANPSSPVVQHEYSPWLLEIRNELENVWLTHELSLEKVPTAEIRSADGICAFLNALSKEKFTTDTIVEEFLANKASLEQFQVFILSDGYLNYRFFDALSLAQRHFIETVKSEISHHLWDECGNGTMENAHTWKFSNSLEAMGLTLPAVPIWEDWRPYAGYNLYFLFGFRREHFFKSLGSLAMPELFDPDRDRAVVKGLERLFPDAQTKFEYFYDHIEVDEGHGSSWLANVICPIVEAQPESAKEFAIGGILRMTAMRRYNEYLAERFGLATLVGETV